ncbi:MAG: hypothetical protein IPP91_09205 [Betaproteobacteria bacterium]|nr:hypothetical protein [Betaproteobacteria bacterium]
MSSVAESLFAPVRAAARRAGLAELFAWWKGELAALVPPAWRERLASRSSAMVAVSGDVWREMRPSERRLVEMSRVDLASLDVAGRRAAFRRFMAEGPGAAGNVWLVLPDEDVLVRTITLPLAAEEALRDAVGFELDRFTPFASGQACFDFRVTGRDVATQQLTLELAVASRAVVDGRLAELQEIGATVLGVSPGHDLAGNHSPLNLLAPERRGRPVGSRAAIAARVLAVLAVILAMAAAIYPLWQKRSAVIRLLPRVATAKAGADVAEHLGKEIEKLAAEHNFALAKKQAQYPMVMLLEELSRLLPDTTWIQQLEVRPGPKGRDLQFYGETGSSSQLIEVLEQSGLVANAVFKSPLTKGATPNTERFFIGAELKSRPIPDPIPEATLVSSSPGAVAGPAAPPSAPVAAPAPAPAAAPAAAVAGAPAAAPVAPPAPARPAGK